MVTLKRIIIDIQASLIEPTVLTRVTGTTVIETLIPATIVLFLQLLLELLFQEVLFLQPTIQNLAFSRGLAPSTKSFNDECFSC